MPMANWKVFGLVWIGLLLFLKSNELNLVTYMWPTFCVLSHMYVTKLNLE